MQEGEFMHDGLGMALDTVVIIIFIIGLPIYFGYWLGRKLKQEK